MASKRIEVGLSPTYMAAGVSGAGTGKGEVTNVPEILEKIGTFVNAIAESYGIDDDTAKFSGIKFPLLGFNHALIRAGFKSLERQLNGNPDMKAAIKAAMTTDMSFENPDRFYDGADQHYTAEKLEALKAAIDVSHKITTIEGEAGQLDITSAEVQTLLEATHHLQQCMQNVAASIPNADRAEPLKALAKDFRIVVDHYALLSERYFGVKLSPNANDLPTGPRGTGN